MTLIQIIRADRNIQLKFTIQPAIEMSKEWECPRTTVETVLTGIEKLPKANKPTADHLTDFDVPFYKVWKKAGNGIRVFFHNKERHVLSEDSITLF